MELWQALLIAILGYFGVNRTPWFFGQAGGFFGIGSPLVGCTIIGAILGDIKEGVLIGAAIQAMYLGVIQPGGALPSDKGFATFIGGSLAIASKTGVEGAIALALPLGLLGVALFQFCMTFNSYFPHLGDMYAEKGDGNGVARANILGTVPTLVIYLFIYTFANYLGVDFVQKIITSFPPIVLTSLSIVGKIVPAVGFAMLLKYVVTPGKEWMLCFFLMGFVLVMNTGFNIVSLVLFATGISVMFVANRYGKDKMGLAKQQDDEGGEYDE